MLPHCEHCANSDSHLQTQVSVLQMAPADWACSIMAPCATNAACKQCVRHKCTVHPACYSWLLTTTIACLADYATCSYCHNLRRQHCHQQGLPRDIRGMCWRSQCQGGFSSLLPHANTNCQDAPARLEQPPGCRWWLTTTPLHQQDHPWLAKAHITHYAACARHKPQLCYHRATVATVPGHLWLEGQHKHGNGRDPFVRGTRAERPQSCALIVQAKTASRLSPHHPSAGTKVQHMLSGKMAQPCAGCAP